MNGTSTLDQAAVEKQILLNGPAGAPPSGISPNLANPPNQDAIIIAIPTVFLVLCTVVGMIRLYTKSLLIRRFEHEDCKSWPLYLYNDGISTKFSDILALAWVSTRGQSFLCIAGMLTRHSLVCLHTLFLYFYGFEVAVESMCGTFG